MRLRVTAKRVFTGGGFTLVEVMVALILVFIVMGAAYMSVTRESVDVDTQEAVVDMQQRARLAVSLLSKSIHRMGFLGCSGVEKANTLANAGKDSSLLGSKTTATNTTPGNAANWDTATNATILDELRNAANVDYLGTPIGLYNDAAAGHPIYRPGTDAISIAWLGGDEAVDPANLMGSTTDPLTILNSNNVFNAGDIMVVTDCMDYSVFEKTNGVALTVQHATGAAPKPPNNNSTDLKKIYSDTSRVFNLNIDTFFIANDANNIPTLYKNGPGSPLIADIEDLQFQVLIDTNQNNDLSDDAWTDATSVTVGNSGRLQTAGGTYDPDLLGAVKVFVLARSDVMAGYTNPNTYDFPNSPYYSTGNPFGSANGAGGAPGDGRYRYLASETIYLRNHAD